MSDDKFQDIIDQLQNDQQPQIQNVSSDNTKSEGLKTLNEGLKHENFTLKNDNQGFVEKTSGENND